MDERADELERKITDESERTRSDVAAVSGKVDDLSRDVRSIRVSISGSQASGIIQFQGGSRPALRTSAA